MATAVIAQHPRPDLAGDVRAGLCRPGQKELLSKYLYDEIGSALFEVVSLLPEYGLTRADERLLQRHATDIVSRLKPQILVAELDARSRVFDILLKKSSAVSQSDSGLSLFVPVRVRKCMYMGGEHGTRYLLHSLGLTCRHLAGRSYMRGTNASGFRCEGASSLLQCLQTR